MTKYLINCSDKVKTLMQGNRLNQIVEKGAAKSITSPSPNIEVKASAIEINKGEDKLSYVGRAD